jgi:hypothetical protein
MDRIYHFQHMTTYLAPLALHIVFQMHVAKQHSIMLSNELTTSKVEIEVNVQRICTPNFVKFIINFKRLHLTMILPNSTGPSNNLRFQPQTHHSPLTPISATSSFTFRVL